jgi:Uma2 family endonuclease
MSHVIDPLIGSWTAVDLVNRFGAIPLARVRHDPPPGTATEADVIRIRDREERLCELVDGTLLEKTVGTYESYLAGILVRLLGNFVAAHHLGIVLPPDGMMRLSPGLVRIPDVSFISWSRLPDGQVPREPIAELVPDLAVEVISAGNTRQEMERKLREFFQAGVRLVWYVYPSSREIHVYSQQNSHEVITESQSLDGGNVLPGFKLLLATFFS